MANVYSTLFAARTISGTGISTNLYTVPAGYVAVVRDITAFGSGTTHQALVGIQFYIESTIYFAAFLEPFVTAGFAYHWEGRQVMNAAQTLACWVNDPGWMVRVSGYLLSLP